ncbi:MAG TPA: RNA polymerase sigma-70 factor [Flavisolibacter sp.]|nr:RNA polymerase sigma-70 factor [Flavisolibacter sp.]
MLKPNFNTEDALQALIQGREEGLHFFFENYYSYLNFFAQKLLHDPLLAEEMVSDAFIKLWEKREELSMEGSIKSLLSTIVRNNCINQLRKAKRMRIGERGLENTETTEQSVLHTIVETETVKEIIHTLDRLPPKCRQVFTLFFLHGKRYKEIAQELKLSPHTVRNQKQRAIRLIKKMITPLCLLLMHSF